MGVLVHAGLDHLPVEVVAFARALADTGENGITAVGAGDVVDEFENENRLADAGAAEQADLAATRVGCEQVNDFDASGKNIGFRGLFGKRRGFGVDRAGASVRRWGRLHPQVRR